MARPQYQLVTFDDDGGDGSATSRTARTEVTRSSNARSPFGSGGCCPRARDFEARHVEFCAHVRLALSTAFWCALFSVPMLFPVSNYRVFGSRITYSELGCTVEGSDARVCVPGRIRGQTFAAPVNASTPCDLEVVTWSREVHGEWDPTFQPASAVLPGQNAHIWCGFLPREYYVYWPNVIQFLIFTVYRSTGTTIQLAWQGFTGTLCATVNVAVMSFFVNEGGAGHVCTDDEVAAFVCVAGHIERADPNFESYQWLLWADIALVYFLFLVSGAEQGTMKWGMAWHSYYMMAFVSPGFSNVNHFKIWPTNNLYWDSERTTVILTSLFGGFFAIVATLTPVALLNKRQAISDSESGIEAVDAVWTNSIEYLCGPGRTGKRLQISKRINGFSVRAAAVQANLDQSWWETMNLGNTGAVLHIMADFDNAVSSIPVRNVMYAVESVLMNENFEGEHYTFTEAMKPTMWRLKSETVHLLNLAQACFLDAVLDDDEAAEINQQILIVEQVQRQLLIDYTKLCPKVSEDYTNELVFLFGLSYWSKCMHVFGHTLADPAPPPPCCVVLFNNLKDGFLDTWSLHKMCSKERLGFAIRNWFGLCIAFVLGYTLHGSVFNRFSCTMPLTLSLLISQFSGSALHKNLHRLLGVALGKVLPVIILAAVSFIPCEFGLRVSCQLAAIFAYVYVFMYMYFASKTWSYVGCLVAGFGTYPLLIYMHCTTVNVEGDAAFVAHYKEIGQVTVVIVLQMAIDSCLVPKSARALAEDAVADIKFQIEQGYAAFFAGNHEGMKASRDKAIEALDKAWALESEVDPMMEVAPSSDTVFKIEMYSSSLRVVKLLISDLSMLCLACEGDEDGTLMLNWFLRLPSVSAMKDDVMSTLEDGLGLFLHVLQHKDESEFHDEHLAGIEGSTGLTEITGMSDMYKHLQSPTCEAEFDRHDDEFVTRDWRVRICVVLTSLDNTAKHAEMIDQHCIKGIGG